MEVNGQTLTTRNIVVATGAAPFVPPIPGLDQVPWHTSETIWSLREHPGRLLILGGGPIGCELSQAFQRLGAQVTQVEMQNRVLGNEDDDVADFVADRLRSEGVELLTGHRVIRFEGSGDEPEAGAGSSADLDADHDADVNADRSAPQRTPRAAGVAVIEHRGQTIRIAFDTLLLAVGRKARVDGFGLEEVGVTLRDHRIETDGALRTRVPTILACGDCVGPYQFTHAASHQAWFAAVNSLFANPFKRFQVDYTYLPRVTFTDPEVARLGLNETDAAEKGIEAEVTRYDLAELDRAITDEVAEGFVKVLTPPGKDRILGVTIVGDHAGELMASFTLAMKHGIGLNKILGTIHAYPTMAEANKFAAGVWKRAHAPERVLRLVERYHGWRRG